MVESSWKRTASATVYSPVLQVDRKEFLLE